LDSSGFLVFLIKSRGEARTGEEKNEEEGEGKRKGRRRGRRG
jgi:hypothetical protein